MLEAFRESLTAPAVPWPLFGVPLNAMISGGRFPLTGTYWHTGTHSTIFCSRFPGKSQVLYSPLVNCPSFTPELQAGVTGVTGVKNLGHLGHRPSRSRRSQLCRSLPATASGHSVPQTVLFAAYTFIIFFIVFFHIFSYFFTIFLSYHICRRLCRVDLFFFCPMCLSACVSLRCFILGPFRVGLRSDRIFPPGDPASLWQLSAVTAVARSYPYSKAEVSWRHRGIQLATWVDCFSGAILGW